MGNPHILLAEDDETLGYLLKEYLILNNFLVTWAKNGEEAWKEYSSKSFSIAVLDVMMPLKDGFTLLREIKSDDNHFPVLLLTSKSLKVDKLKGFKYGADDYILKPVDEEELVARINAVLRRQDRESGNQLKLTDYQMGGYVFNFNNQTLCFDEQVIQLSARESELLKVFCDNPNVLIERNQILKKYWGNTDFFSRKSMDVFIYKLRNYLSKDSSIKITNVHGKGYIMTTASINEN
jgi:DNA-binding response OmpR family regulator